MKFTLAILLLFAFTACNPDFHKQKHTDFGHGKTVKLQEANTLHHEIAEPEMKIREIPVQENVAVEFPPLTFTDVTAKPDTGKTVSTPDTLTKIELLRTHTIDPVVSDSVSIENYIETIRHERNKNAIIGGLALILLGATFLTGYIPMLVFFGALLFIFGLITLSKQSRYNKLLRYPEQFQNPKDKPRFSKDSRKTARSLFITAMVCLSLLILLLLIIFIVVAFLSLLAGGIAVGIGFLWLLIPVGVILILLMFSIINSRNYNRGRRLRGEPIDDVLNGLSVWSWVLGLLGGLITIFAAFGDYLRDLYL